MNSLSLLLLVVAVVSAQNDAQSFGGSSGGSQTRIPCGFTCTREATFMQWIDGTWSSVQCSWQSFLTDRCGPCCQAYALSGGLDADSASGFPATDGRSCVCCTSNNRCGGGPVPAAAFGGK